METMEAFADLFLNVNVKCLLKKTGTEYKKQILRTFCRVPQGW